MNEKDERKEKDVREQKDMRDKKAVRKEDFNTENNVRGKEDIREERNTKEIEQIRENIDNRSEAGDAIWTRTNETGVTREAWKVPVTSTTTGDATKNMQANNALQMWKEGQHV